MQNQLKEVSTNTLFREINNPELTIIDVRPIEAYNGWPLYNEHRGGHIKGAKSLPRKWSKYLDWLDIVRSKNISKEHDIILYGYTEKDAVQVAELMMQAGYKNVKVYHHFIDEWSVNNKYPMEKLARYQQLVYPAWVNDIVERKKKQLISENEYVICHTHYGFEEDYSGGHIPGAISLNTNWLESTETWNRHSPEELKRTLEQSGIKHDSTVILYGRFAHPNNDDPYPGQSAGHLAAMRCAAIMMYAGVNDVRILNGGLTAWLDEGYPLTQTETKPVPVQEFGKEIPGNPEIFIDTAKARELLAAENGDLISVRSWDEFIGKVSGYHYIEKKGRIPGAVFGNCGSDAYHMENYRNLDHTMLEYHEVLDQWQELGISTNKYLAFYCGTGWRGSEAFMNAYLMGLPNISVYDGGWFEWSNDENNPIETGTPK